jgi:hypothetical protein
MVSACVDVDCPWCGANYLDVAPGGRCDCGALLRLPARRGGSLRPMILLGLILLVLGILLHVHVLFVIGIVLLVVGVALAIAGGSGRAVGGRRHWY